MKFKRCRQLLKKLSVLSFTEHSDQRKNENINTNKKLTGKQVYSNKTGSYGYITEVMEVDDNITYIIDWTSYGELGGFPKIIQERHETLDDLIVLDR